MLTVSAFILGAAGPYSADGAALLSEAGDRSAARIRYALGGVAIVASILCVVMGASH